jgi:hypothetical protein
MSSVRFQRVKPGDLITSELINAILTEVEHLQDQLDGLSGGQPEAPVITALVPAGDVPSPSELLILGRNFAIPAILNAVSLDDIVLTSFLPGSSDTRLRIGMPGGIPGLPRTMTLAVATDKGSGFATVRVIPVAPSIGGKPVVANATTGGQTVTAGQTCSVTFQLSGENLLRAEQFRLNVSFTDPVPAGSDSQWGVQMIGTEGAGAPGDTVTIAPADRRLVNAQFRVPAGVTSVTASLQATSVNNSPASDAVSLPVKLTVGQPVPGSDGGVQMSFGQGGNSIKFDLVDGLSGALIRYGATAILRITATYVEAGTYQFALAVDNPGVLWTVTQPSQPVRTPAAPGNDSIEFLLKLNPAGPSGEKRIATVTATRQDPAGAGRSSVISFPIVGFS